MARRSVQVDLQDVPLHTRFRKFSGDRRDKVRARAKIEVVRIGEDKFGVTVKRGVVSVKKGTVSGSGLTEATVLSAVRKAIKAGEYDTALFDDYDRIQAQKQAKSKSKKG